VRKWLRGTSSPRRDAYLRAVLGLDDAAKGSEGCDGRMSRGQSSYMLNNAIVRWVRESDRVALLEMGGEEE
jgi:hypothetical protein